MKKLNLLIFLLLIVIFNVSCEKEDKSTDNNSPDNETYGIYVRITGTGSYDYKNVTIEAIKGSISKSCNTGGTNNCGITGVRNGTWTVTPSKEGFIFSPSSREVTIDDESEWVSFSVSHE